jgi:hypothetical protein
MDEAGPAERTPRRRRHHQRSLSGSEKKVGAARQSQGGSRAEQARKGISLAGPAARPKSLREIMNEKESNERD